MNKTRKPISVYNVVPMLGIISIVSMPCYYRLSERGSSSGKYISSYVASDVSTTSNSAISLKALLKALALPGTFTLNKGI